MFAALTLLAHVVFSVAIVSMLNLIASTRFSRKMCVVYGAFIGLLLATISLLP